MNKIIIKQFDTIIYPRQIWIAAGGTREDIASNFKDSDGDPFLINPDDIRDSEALTYGVNDKSGKIGGSLVWFHDTDKMTSRNITHESVHAANIIFSDLGIKIDTDNDEAQAYLAGFVADCIDKVQIEVVKRKISSKK
jgi:hypothetical protein